METIYWFHSYETWPSNTRLTGVSEILIPSCEVSTIE
ncbi:unnamed protein product [Nezara viridula]|uniref:Uncharacterized protein n=1 Tax=Nezara viridula TaxID=85310 RepID=A0A9P0EAI7_NEZVI|nr:unnamed protein product [Nezara viridula]